MMRLPSTEVAVVGAGIVGLSTTYALQRRGIEVRCFESARPGAGQSAGRTRIFRHAHVRPELALFAAEAGGVWHEWERDFGVSLLGREGLLVTGEAAHERGAVLAGAGLPHRLIGPDELLVVVRHRRQSLLPTVAVLHEDVIAAVDVDVFDLGIVEQRLQSPDAEQCRVDGGRE